LSHNTLLKLLQKVAKIVRLGEPHLNKQSLIYLGGLEQGGGPLFDSIVVIKGTNTILHKN